MERISKDNNELSQDGQKASKKAFDLTGELAHEIKNPLSTVKINLELIEEDLEELKKQTTSAGIDEHYLFRAQRKITIVRNETQRLEQILEGFLQYNDNIHLEFDKVDLNQIVGDMIDFYTPQAFSHSVVIRHQLCSDPLICRIDNDAIKQAVLNLFINALDAMTNGGDLIIRTCKKDKNALLEISDTGIGIEKKMLDKIFNLYYSSRPNGRGVGLSTTKKIVLGHKGEISVESEIDRGTCFTVSLPLDKK